VFTPWLCTLTSAFRAARNDHATGTFRFIWYWSPIFVTTNRPDSTFALSQQFLVPLCLDLGFAYDGLLDNAFAHEMVDMELDTHFEGLCWCSVALSDVFVGSFDSSSLDYA